MVLTCEHHTRPEISGSRKIAKIQSNAIACELDPSYGNGHALSWCYWPKADQMRVNESSVTILDGGTASHQSFTYHLPVEAMDDR